MKSWLRIAFFVVVGLNCVNPLPASSTTGGTGGGLWRAFYERVAAYAALHYQVADRLPALAPSNRIDTVLATRATLAASIVATRRNARQGDIFTPSVGDLFRRVIAHALDGVDSEVFLRNLYEGEAIPPGYVPRVHEALPDWATHEVPVVLLMQLPPLPACLEYRLLDHSLVLWDVDAGLIVDVLPDAIPYPVS